MKDYIFIHSIAHEFTDLEVKNLHELGFQPLLR